MPLADVDEIENDSSEFEHQHKLYPTALITIPGECFPTNRKLFRRVLLLNIAKCATADEQKM
jgi:hypothetical protein